MENEFVVTIIFHGTVYHVPFRFSVAPFFRRKMHHNSKKKKKKYAIFGQCDLYYFLRRYLTSWQSANIPAPVYSIGLPKKKAVYHVSYIKFVTSNRNIILTCTCIMSIKPFSDIFSLILLMTSSLKTHTYNAKSPRSND